MMPIATGTPAVHYPDSDGKPMAENTLQYQWIVTIQGNLDLIFAHDPNVFVAGDNLIYPVEGSNTIRQAPDIYVAFGRPKGHRGSYRVWEEGGIFPQVVFEVLSPGNRAGEMTRKRQFYEKYGAEEYYVVDPDHIRGEGYLSGPNGFHKLSNLNGWISPRLGIRFDLDGDLNLYDSQGNRFRSFVELGQAQQETARVAEQEKQRADKLAAKLRALGMDPDA